MRTHQAFPSRYLKAVSLNGKPLRVTIDRLENEEIGGEEKFVIYFQERDQGLALNKTNFESLEYLHGDSDEWPGKMVELYPNHTSYQGKRVPCIRVRAASKDGQLLLSIGNTGKSIAAEAQVHIFKRFRRAAAGSGVTGHGLGLNLARELARLHGGDLKLVSSEDDWTEFELLLQAVKRSANTST